MSCACPVGRACSSPSAAASVERCRVRGRDDLGDRHHPVLPLVVATAGASGWNQHPPWSGRGGHRAVQALGQGQAAGRDLAGPCGGCCRAGSPCSRSLGRRAYPPRRGGASRVGVLFPSGAISFALESAHQLERDLSWAARSGLLAGHSEVSTSWPFTRDLGSDLRACAPGGRAPWHGAGATGIAATVALAPAGNGCRYFTARVLFRPARVELT